MIGDDVFKGASNVEKLEALGQHREECLWFIFLGSNLPSALVGSSAELSSFALASSVALADFFPIDFASLVGATDSDVVPSAATLADTS